MIKVSFYIDGFNLYHSLVANPQGQLHKWLDIKSLAESIIRKKESIRKINFYTAYPTWIPEKVARHKTLVSVYQDLGINVVFGEFRSKEVICSNCRNKRKVRQEKRTDVNIAIDLVGDAAEEIYDIAYLVSGDSDLIPAVQRVRSKYPEKIIRLVIPPNGRAKELTNSCNDHLKLDYPRLAQNQLPNPYTKQNGKTIDRPAEWL